jgi:glutamine synthetase
VAGPLIAMNTMLAESLNWIADELESTIDGKSNAAIREGTIKVLKKLMKEHGAAVFGGDGYSSEWHEMAVKERGLKNLPTTADALPYLKDDVTKSLFEGTGVLSETELASRFEVYSEIYINRIALEANLVQSMAKTAIYPAATRYLSDLALTAASANEMGVDFDNGTAKTVANNINGMMKAVAKLEKAAAKDGFNSEEEHMQFCANDICDLMDDVRGYADALEGDVADDMWPLPTYHEMLFIK